MNRNLKKPLATLSFIMLAIVSCVYFSNNKNNGYDAYEVAMQFDKEHPGRGLDLYTDNVQDHAMAYGLYASTAAMLGMEEEARKSAEWLVDNAEHQSAYGWGLPYAWDAFQDGSVNPVDTVYGITTAIAVRGLLDSYVKFGGKELAESAMVALDYYSDHFTTTAQGGYFWYSDQSQDEKDTHNVSSMLLGQYARAGSLFSRDDYLEISRAAFTHLWEHRIDTEFGIKWHYSDYADTPNDAVHAAYIVQGIIDYSKYSGEIIETSELVKYLQGFIHSGGASEFNKHEHISEALLEQPARGWGVGMLIYTFADVGEGSYAEKAERSLTDYEFSANKFSVMPNEETFTPRTQAHISFGLARLKEGEI